MKHRSKITSDGFDATKHVAARERLLNKIKEYSKRTHLCAWIYSWRMAHREEQNAPEWIDFGGES